MKTIKVMIAASEEMHGEKTQFSSLIENLNEVLAPRGIELKRVKWNPEADGSLEDFQTKLRDCEMCLTLYWRELAGNSKEELNTAYQELKDGKNPRNLYVFFKEPSEELTEALKDFKANFVTEYGHFFCKFENVDTMNLHFILQFASYLNQVEDKLVSVSGGKVKVGDKDFVNLDNVPFAALNKEYQRLQKELNELDNQVAEVKKRHNADPDNEELKDEFFSIRLKRKKLAEEFEKYQTYLYYFALCFAKQSEEKYSERMRKARELFEVGKVIEAEQQFEQNRQNLELKIEEFRLKADMVMANISLTVQERFAEACDAYEEAISSAKEIHYDEEKLSRLLFDYAYHLQRFNRIYEAMEYYTEALEIRRKLAEAYLPDVAMTLNNLAILKNEIEKKDEAVRLWSEALDIYERLEEQHPGMYADRTKVIIEYILEHKNELK